jgi:hypothetical protein
VLRSIARLFGIYLPHPEARFNSHKANILAALILDLDLKKLAINPKASIEETSRALNRWSHNVYPDYVNFKALTAKIYQCYGSEPSKLRVYWTNQSKIQSESQDALLAFRLKLQYITYLELYIPSMFDDKTRQKIFRLEMLSDDELLLLLRKQISW